jgi:site-specific recombinase XerD
MQKEGGNVSENQSIILSGTSSLVIRYLNSLDVKPKTKDTYRKALKQFTAWITLNRGEVTQKADILAYKAYLISTHSAATVSAYITAVKGFYKWLEAENIAPNIASGIKGAKSSRAFKKDVLTIEQAKKMLSSINLDSLSGLRDYALINLLLRTGLRTIEVERANISDIRQQGGQALLFIQGKGRDEKDDFVCLTPATLDPLMKYLIQRKETNSDAALFAADGNRSKGERLTTRSIRRIVKRVMLDAGINSERLTAHSLRHTAITFALLAGASLPEVQKMARHTSINTTMIYNHSINRIGNAPEKKIDSLLDEI